MLAWLSVCSKVQMICVWSSWCHCHPIISCFITIQSGLTFLLPAYPGFLEKRPLNVYWWHCSKGRRQGRLNMPLDAKSTRSSDWEDGYGPRYRQLHSQAATNVPSSCVLRWSSEMSVTVRGINTEVTAGLACEGPRMSSLSRRCPPSPQTPPEIQQQYRLISAQCSLNTPDR